jgi:hypothetical protein
VGAPLGFRHASRHGVRLSAPGRRHVGCLASYASGSRRHLCPRRHALSRQWWTVATNSSGRTQFSSTAESSPPLTSNTAAARSSRRAARVATKLQPAAVSAAVARARSDVGRQRQSTRLDSHPPAAYGHGVPPVPGRLHAEPARVNSARASVQPVRASAVPGCGCTSARLPTAPAGGNRRSRRRYPGARRTRCRRTYMC